MARRHLRRRRGAAHRLLVPLLSGIVFGFCAVYSALAYTQAADEAAAALATTSTSTHRTPVLEPHALVRREARLVEEPRAPAQAPPGPSRPTRTPPPPIATAAPDPPIATAAPAPRATPPTTASPYTLCTPVQARLDDDYYFLPNAPTPQQPGATVDLALLGYGRGVGECAAKEACRWSTDCGGIAWPSAGGPVALTVAAASGLLLHQTPTSSTAPRGRAWIKTTRSPSSADSLRASLARFDAAPALQLAHPSALRASAHFAPFRTNATVAHRAGATAVAYRAHWIPHESWVLGSPGTTTDGGLCACKSACASHGAQCRGFVYRWRDGACVAYGGGVRLARSTAELLPGKHAKLVRKLRTLTVYYEKLGAGDAAAALGPRDAGCGGGQADSEAFQRRPVAALEASFPRYRHATAGVVPWATAAARFKSHPVALPAPRLAQQDEEVWISLTTLPSRIAQIQATLQSLTAQTVPATVRLAVPKTVRGLVPSGAGPPLTPAPPPQSRRPGEGTGYALPKWLASSAEAAVVVDRVDVDYGPATKLIPAVQRGLRSARGDALIIVVDDDTLYPPRLVETLLEWHKRLPHAALSFTGWPVKDDLTYPHWSENYLVYGNELLSPHPVDVVRGNCGYLVRASFFTPALWEDLEGAPDGAKYVVIRFAAAAATTQQYYTTNTNL